MARGEASALDGWPVPLALDALHKVCHDAMSRASGAMPRYFLPDRVPAHGRLAALALWLDELDRVARHDDHPWNEGLLLEALVQRGAAALNNPRGRGAGLARGLDTLPP